MTNNQNPRRATIQFSRPGSDLKITIHLDDEAKADAEVDYFTRLFAADPHTNQLKVRVSRF